MKSWTWGRGDDDVEVEILSAELARLEKEVYAISHGRAGGSGEMSDICTGIQTMRRCDDNVFL